MFSLSLVFHPLADKVLKDFVELNENEHLVLETSFSLIKNPNAITNLLREDKEE